ncbi:MAG: hypothetical protein RBT55_13080 [Rhodocyclaceae bacterium]|jgi:hypothetical protein|nr:hypothetical protein [Rhodocyclaceae bacterium]
MDSRHNHRLRRLIDHALKLVGRNVISADLAAETMVHAGAPMEVVCRVLAPYRQEA